MAILKNNNSPQGLPPMGRVWASSNCAINYIRIKLFCEQSIYEIQRGISSEKPGTLEENTGKGCGYHGEGYHPALAREGVSADKVLREARQAADGYIKQGKVWNRRLERIPAPVWGALGAGLASLGWAAWLFLL